MKKYIILLVVVFVTSGCSFSNHEMTREEFISKMKEIGASIENVKEKSTSEDYKNVIFHDNAFVDGEYSTMLVKYLKVNKNKYINFNYKIDCEISNGIVKKTKNMCEYNTQNLKYFVFVNGKTYLKIEYLKDSERDKALEIIEKLGYSDYLK